MEVDSTRVQSKTVQRGNLKAGSKIIQNSTLHGAGHVESGSADILQGANLIGGSRDRAVVEADGGANGSDGKAQGASHKESGGGQTGQETANDSEVPQSMAWKVASNSVKVDVEEQAVLDVDVDIVAPEDSRLAPRTAGMQNQTRQDQTRQDQVVAWQLQTMEQEVELQATAWKPLVVEQEVASLTHQSCLGTR